MARSHWRGSVTTLNCAFFPLSLDTTDAGRGGVHVGDAGVLAATARLADARLTSPFWPRPPASALCPPCCAGSLLVERGGLANGRLELALREARRVQLQRLVQEVVFRIAGSLIWANR